LQSDQSTSTSDNETPEDWIKNRILQKNIPENGLGLRARYLSRLGIDPKSLSKEEFNKLNQLSMDAAKKIEEINEDDKLNSQLKLEKSYSTPANDFSLNFLIKTDDEVRNNFINKLFNYGILKPAPAKKHQSMIIYDWDDTLLCTTYLGSLGFVDIPADNLALLKPLDESASKLLHTSCQFGEIFIITNSAEGWVQYSSKLFLPKTHEAILAKKIKVISARSGYEDQYPGDCHKWKVEAFLDIKKDFSKNLITNLICLGDSHIEIDAAHVLAKEFNQAIIKTIKFREGPKPEELVKQQELVNEKFEQIYMSVRNLTIRLEKKNSSSQLG